MEMNEEELERRRHLEIEEVREAIAKISEPKFKELENLHRLTRMLKKEIELLETATLKSLEAHLVTCNYAFYKSIIDEIEEMGNATAVLKTFRRNEVSVTVDIVAKEPNVWIKLVNRPAKTVLIEYRDGKRHGDVIAQIKQHHFVSLQYNKPEIRVCFKKGVVTEMAEKLTRHGIVVIGERIDKSHPSLIGKWNEGLVERLGEQEDSSWEEEEEGIVDLDRSPASTLPRLNLDSSAVMLLVSNMCEPDGVNFVFKEEMINQHVMNEREKPAKSELLKKLKGHQLIMSEFAFQRVSEIVKNVGGPKEKRRFAELSEELQLIPDLDVEEVGRVAKLSNIKGITPVTKRVFSCAEVTKTTTVTANQKFLMHSKAKNVYFNVIEIPPRPLTEQKEAHAEIV